MALRVLLVALVAAMGLELPDSAKLASWTNSARGWVAARMAELPSFEGDETPAASTAEAVPGRADLVFEAVSEAMASGFAADLASMKSKPTVETALASVEPEGEPTPEVAAAPTAQAPPIERISEAVRLTRQAVDAWASLIQPTADRPAGVDDPVDSF
jgi:hypothetical protein